MTYESKITDFSKEHIYVVELELDYCGYEYGVDQCSAGLWEMGMFTISVDDFNVGDEIEGDLSGAVGIISAISGSSPSYTFEYTSTNGLNFRSGSNETITNNTATGVGDKDSDVIVLLTPDDEKCFNSINSCDDLVSFQPTANITTGPQTIDYDAGLGRFLRSSGSYTDDGFVVGDRIRVSGYNAPAINTEFVIDSLFVNALIVTESGNVGELGTGDEVIELIPRKIYRFCEARSPHPIAIDAIPSLETVSITASKIDVAGGMGERSSVSLTFRDHPHSDIDIDKYLANRSWIASDRATFWTKLRARNPNYQFKAVRLLTGYLEDGKYLAENFKARNYVIEKMDVTAGKCSITAKDPLKLASSKKAQVPIPNTGILVAGINDSVTTATLTPTGIGNSEYDASGNLNIGDEVMGFTRSGDVLTITRGVKGTTASSHDAGDAVQECYVKNAEVNVIIEDIFTNFANIDPRFINSAAWQTEVDEFLNGLLDGIIVRPTDVNKVFKELALAKPLSLHWDELNQTIKLDALKAPPTSANVIDMDSGVVLNSFKTKDLPDMRVSTVFFTFGQVDPTKPITELSNYTQTVTRVDGNSISKYGSSAVKSIVSRWINSGNKPAAQNAAQLFGRRFSDIPREIEFSLEAKDSALLIGQTRAVNHRDMVDVSGLPVDTLFQIISAKEADVFRYKGVEYRYGEVVAGDNDIDTDTILFSVDEQNVDLRARYESLIGVPDGSTVALFKVEAGVIIGSSLTATDAVDTGAWPAGATVTLINNGHIVGAGGKGGNITGSTGENAGDAINLSYALTIDNFGIIGGGGGGGGSTDSGGFYHFSGCGGAGNSVGLSGGSSAVDGSLELGGTEDSGAHAPGGDLGLAGVSSDFAGGTAGKAIDKNGFTLTETETGDIRGAVS